MTELVGEFLGSLGGWTIMASVLGIMGGLILFVVACERGAAYFKRLK